MLDAALLDPASGEEVVGPAEGHDSTLRLATDPDPSADVVAFDQAADPLEHVPAQLAITGQDHAVGQRVEDGNSGGRERASPPCVPEKKMSSKTRMISQLPATAEIGMPLPSALP